MPTSQTRRSSAAQPFSASPIEKAPDSSFPTAGPRLLLWPACLALAIAGFALLTKDRVLELSFLGAAAFLLVWCAALFVAVRRSHRAIRVEFVIRAQHWLQGLTQFSVIVWWALHTPVVFAFFPFYLVQLIFAFALDSLLNWSRRDVYTMGFGPLPVILSINIFLLFKPEWFYWQFVMVTLGFLAKEFIRWDRDGRKAHIFNPSSFPLSVFSLVLLVTGTTEITFGNFNANTIFDTPHIFAAVFLLALPVQILFGVVRMTLSAALTMYLLGLVYLAATGTYFFYDAYIPPAVFIGMTLLVTDPSTSPRSDLGRIVFGVLYAVFTMALFVVLERFHAPTFYDKLLPIPIMNLMVRRIDALTRSKWLARFAPERLFGALTPTRRNVAWTSVWALIFGTLAAVGGVGDKHPGQYLPFWHEACAKGSSRACTYAASLTVVYCNKGSGWACNESGILDRRLGQLGAARFRRGCELGFQPACDNLTKPSAPPATLASAPPSIRDLPVVLSGTKPTLRERDPDKLYALACEQRWPGACDGSWSR